MKDERSVDAVSAPLGDLVGRLRKEAEARGWAFYVEPSPTVTPDFLKGFRPDALAIGPEGGTVIEIKTRRQTGQDDRIARLARLVEAQKGWNFRLFYVPPPDDLGSDLPPPKPEELLSGIVEARMLLDSGHTRAAFLLAWSLLEAAARMSSAQVERALTKALSPIQSIQTLVELGHLDEETARRLREMARLRNAVVHGSLQAAVPTESATLLIQALEDMTAGLVAAA